VAPLSKRQSEEEKTDATRPEGTAEAWARIGHNQPPRTGISRRQPENTKMASHLICPGWVPFSERMSESPVTESNRRPSPYHGRSSRLEGSRWVASVQVGTVRLSGSY
jgi:hypothetical protein